MYDTDKGADPFPGTIRKTTKAMTVLTIEQAGNDLLAELDRLEEQQARVARAKENILALMTAEGVKTAKLGWGQVQVVSTDVWEYRDRGVTEARKSVEAKERELKGAKAVLKGAEGAAKASGGARARVTATNRAVRVVRVGAANAVGGA